MHMQCLNYQQTQTASAAAKCLNATTISAAVASIIVYILNATKQWTWIFSTHTSHSGRPGLVLDSEAAYSNRCFSWLSCVPPSNETISLRQLISLSININPTINTLHHMQLTSKSLNKLRNKKTNVPLIIHMHCASYDSTCWRYLRLQHTLSSLSTDEHIVRNLSDGTPHASNNPSSSCRWFTLMRKSPSCKDVRISLTTRMHSTSGIMGSYWPAMSKSCQHHNLNKTPHYLLNQQQWLHLQVSKQILWDFISLTGLAIPLLQIIMQCWES